MTRTDCAEPPEGRTLALLLVYSLVLIVVAVASGFCFRHFYNSPWWIDITAGGFTGYVAGVVAWISIVLRLEKESRAVTAR